VTRRKSAITVLIFLVAFSVEAYDNERVHPNINYNATLQSSEFITAMKALAFSGDSAKEVMELNFVNNKNIKDWFAEGGTREDEPACRCRHHFHDPLRQWAQAGLESYFFNTTCADPSDLNVQRGSASLVWAQNNPGYAGNFWSWPKAREYYYLGLTSEEDEIREDYLSKTFRALGQVIHLLSDASVPAHVRNDVHVFPLSLPLTGVEVGGQTYESWAKRNFKRLNYAGSSVGREVFDQAVYNTTAPHPISSLWDTNRYTGGSIATITGDAVVGLAEYTNANFFSGDTIFAAYPHPAHGDTNYYGIDWLHPEVVDAEDGVLDNRIYIRKTAGQPIEHLASLSYIAFDCLQKGHVEYSPLVLDDRVYEEYASHLVPKAVGYSRELVDYFFRGAIDLLPDRTLGSGYVIINNSEEDLEGSFEIYYDDFNKMRKLLWRADLTLGAKASGSNESVNISFSAPGDAGKPGRYMLVFTGRLGNEDSVVIGRATEPVRDKLFLLNVYPAEYVLFDMDTANGAYRLTPATGSLNVIPSYEESIWGKNLVVQSNPERTEHYAFFPLYKFDANGEVKFETYRNSISNYGVGVQDYCWLGSGGYYCTHTFSGAPFCYRPEGFSDGSPYVWSSSDYALLSDSYTNPAPIATGRTNYSLDSNNVLVSYQNSIWKRMVDGNCDQLPEFYFRSRIINDEWVDGDVLARNEVHSQTCSLDNPGSWRLEHNPIALISRDKALMVSTRTTYAGERETAQTFSANLTQVETTTGMRCQLSNQTVTREITKELEKNITASGLSGDTYVIQDELKMGDVSLERLDFHMGRIVDASVDLYRMPWTETSQTIEYLPECSEPGDYPVCWYGACETELTYPNYGDAGAKKGYFPDPWCTYCGDMQYIESLVYKSGDRIKEVIDYVNSNDDKTFLTFYVINTTEDQTLSQKSFHGGSSPTLENLSTSSVVANYILAYRVDGGDVAKINLANNESRRTISRVALAYDLSTNKFTHDYSDLKSVSGYRINGVSTYHSDVYMVYTYMLENWDNVGENWIFEKRIVGIINVSDPSLPGGYRQEFKIDSSGTDFKPEWLSGIGITK
jgi:hypothetical protein